jgi:hypothetical protein
VYKWCVPNSGYSCPCGSKRDGVTHQCKVENASGKCLGSEACNGKTGKWEGCDAPTPAAETCNGKDDDCTGKADDGDPNLMCASQGPKPTHASWACNAGTCSVGACDQGWVVFPAGSATDGCNCQLETGEPNGTCATATAAGSVSDTGAPITISGTLSGVNDVDYWSFDAVDTNEATTNSFHLAIAFAAPTANDEFLMDVMRGTCADTPTGPSMAITAYDWCVNGSNGTTPHKGEASCGPQGEAHCGSYGGKVYVRVYRKAGAPATCTQYQLTASAKGGTCDFTQTCP